MTKTSSSSNTHLSWHLLNKHHAATGRFVPRECTKVHSRSKQAIDKKPRPGWLARTGFFLFIRKCVRVTGATNDGVIG
jgi:hypothetical protein